MITPCLDCGKPRRYSPSKCVQRCYRCYNRARTGKPGQPRKLTEALVVLMRSEIAAGTASRTGLARRLGLATSTVSDIVARRAWSHVS